MEWVVTDILKEHDAPNFSDQAFMACIRMTRIANPLPLPSLLTQHPVWPCTLPTPTTLYIHTISSVRVFFSDCLALKMKAI
jgi:hypothetical protein